MVKAIEAFAACGADFKHYDGFNCIIWVNICLKGMTVNSWPGRPAISLRVSAVNLSITKFRREIGRASCRERV